MGGKRVIIPLGYESGRLTVIGDGSTPFKKLCECKCGNTLEVQNSVLHRRRKISCGKCPKKWIAGQKFGKLTAISPTGEIKSSSSVWNCSCDCGGNKQVPVNYLTQGSTKSCGCDQYKGNPKDITGIKRNKLTAVSCTEEKCSNGDYLWKFSCDCGGEVITSVGRFNSDHCKSCGCLSKEAARDRDNYHGLTSTSEYKSWCKMKERCYNTNDIEYPKYGEVGITMCDEWKESFLNFYNDMGTKPNKNYTIDRIDVKGNYTPSNCRWASPYVQSRNQFSYKGSSKYKGVQWEDSSKKWIATISVGKLIVKKIGRYSDEEVAAKAYNLASEMIFGENCTFLTLNPVDKDYSKVNLNCKFFNYWVYEMIKEKEMLYESEV